MQTNEEIYLKSQLNQEIDGTRVEKRKNQFCLEKTELEQLETEIEKLDRMAKVWQSRRTLKKQKLLVSNNLKSSVDKTEKIPQNPRLHSFPFIVKDVTRSVDDFFAFVDAWMNQELFSCQIAYSSKISTTDFKVY